MQSVPSTMFVYFCVVLATTTLIHSGHSFTAQVQVTKSRTPAASALYGKRERALNKVKKIFNKDDKDTPAAAAEETTDSNLPIDRQQVKLSNSRAKDLAKKYKDIDDVGERAFQVLVDLKMVGRS